MKSYVLQLMVISITALFSSNLFAHEGHDHAHWTSNFVHILFYASIVAVAAAVSYALFKRYSNKKLSS